jgi:predicted transcriptional regulator
MRLSEVREILKADLLTGEEQLDMDIIAGAGGDLMSDILRGPKEGVLLLSGLNNIQSVRTAVIAGASALVLVRGKIPDDDMRTQARENNLPLLSTPFTMFTACGRLFNAGLRGVEKKRQE